MDAPSPEHICTVFSNLKALKILGQGAMGTVFLVHDTKQDPEASVPFALKVVEKSAMQDKSNAEGRARWEVQVLSRTTSCPHPFLPRLLSSYLFESSEYLAWSLPFCPGGDLNALRYRQCDGVFSVSVARFYLAEILLGLEHLHELGIVYRDLKPENVLVQSSGHVTLTDFDLSRSLNKSSANDHIAAASPARDRNKTNNFLKRAKSARVSPVKPGFGERSYSFVGTDEYLSPEVVRGDGHEFAVDWWALGILAYEMIYGSTPFKGRNRKETLWNVLNKKPVFVAKRSDMTDLIDRLLHKDPTRRLGYLHGAWEIKNHPYFQSVQWDLLTSLHRAPFIPSVEDDDHSLSACRCEGFDIREYFVSRRATSSPSRFSHRDDTFPQF